MHVGMWYLDQGAKPGLVLNLSLVHLNADGFCIY